MSLATCEDLTSFRLGHSQDVLKLHEVVQLSHLLLRQAFCLLSLDQLSDSALCVGRGVEIGDRFRSCARGDELDNLEIGGAANITAVFSGTFATSTVSNRRLVEARKPTTELHRGGI